MNFFKYLFSITLVLTFLTIDAQTKKIEDVEFLKFYNIPRALPKLSNLQYDISPSKTKLKDGIFLAGDVLLNGSLNAAILAGEKAAMGVLEAIEKNVTQS